MRNPKNILVTGGAGFIGTNFIRFLVEKEKFAGRIINLDKVTYAGNPENLSDIEPSRYQLILGDICDRALVEKIFLEDDIDTVVHFAAESHVDRSILAPDTFIQTNILGTFTLLDVARKSWAGRLDVLFHHISTDEVFGSLGDDGFFTENTPYDPRSPYSASKASSDHLVRAYYHTYGLPITISNCSNNYGPYQFPEKLIPLMIQNILDGKSLPVYGDGRNVRDWLFVQDHVSAIWTIIKFGKIGSSYNIGGENEWENIKLLDKLIEIVSEKIGKSAKDVRSTISFIKDRPGHDRRYAINCELLKNELGWHQQVSFDEGLRKTVDWYLGNPEWISSIIRGDYLKWINSNYEKR